MPKFEWDDKLLTIQVKNATDASLDACARYLKDSYVRVLGVNAGNSAYARAVRRTRGNLEVGPLRKIIAAAKKGQITQARARALATYEKHRHSRPGEPPRKITGKLQSSVSHDAPSANVRRVGLLTGDAIYGYFLDRGHRVMRHGRVVGYTAPRPWLVKTAQDEAKNLSDVMEGASKSAVTGDGKPS